MKSIVVKNISDLPAAAKAIMEFAGDKNIFCFYGDLGAGKTTLIKEICRQLGVKDSGSSPTFSLINEYMTDKGQALYHFDLYRLKNENEIYDIGYEDYVFGKNYCFIEWPEKIEKLLPKDMVNVRIKVSESQRLIELE